MWFKKSKTAPPPVEEEEKFIEWILKYADDLESVRKLYRSNIDKFIEINLKSVLQEIRERNLASADALLTRSGDIREFFEEIFRPLVEARGGLAHCPPELQAGAAMLIVKMSVMLYMAKNKFNAPIPEELLGMSKL